MEEAENENIGILVLEAKSLRPFKTKDEYLYAMREDLAEWFNHLYENMSMSADNFFDILETGVLLCQLANRVRSFAEEQKSKGDFAVKSNFVRDIQIPQFDVQFKVDIKPGTFLARDNISNFITWTAKMGISEVLRFETDDLVLRKNERSVILCLLEVARVGAKFGMLAPTIVQMEAEIDNEIETGEPAPQIKTCDIKSLDEMVRELVGRCTCPVQLPIIKVGEGKYKIGDNQALVFVRILRKHVMIRVGGGWDTLEHYLDRHDPCRCGFQGSRVSTKTASAPGRSSQPAVSESLSSTSKSQRKLSMAIPLNAAHSGSTTRPVVSSMRSISSGPNARKVSLAGKSFQHGSYVVSPVNANKQTKFTTTGLNTSENTKSSGTSDGQQNMSGSGISSAAKQNILKKRVSSSDSTDKQSQVSLTRKVSSTATRSQKTPTTPPTPTESCSKSNSRSQSTVSKMSDFPTPIVNDRLSSPSPAPSSHTSECSNRTHSVLATNSCGSPMKQITLSELRSCREGKVANSQQVQRSPVYSAKSEMMSESTNLNFQLKKANTMSVPNKNCNSHHNSSESPVSQSGDESGRHKNHSATNISTKSANNNRVVCWTKRATSSGVTPETKNGISKSVQNSHANSKSYLNTSVREYSNVSSTSGKKNRPFALCHSNLTTPEIVFRAQSSPSDSKTVSSSPISKQNTHSQTKAKASAISENSCSSKMSRSSSHSSLLSNECIIDDQNSLETAANDQTIKMLTPSSTKSDIFFQNYCRNNSDSRSNSITICSADGDCDNWDTSINSARASSKPKEIVLSDTKINGTHCDKAFNVGHATFSHDKAIDAIDCQQRLEVSTDTIDSCKNAEEIVKFGTTPNDKSQGQRHEISSIRKLSGQLTPSHLARPFTPKMSNKMSLPESKRHRTNTVDDSKNCGQTPSPRKSTVLTRAHNSGTNKQSPIQASRKRSTTPGLESNLLPNNMSQVSKRRSLTPGPHLQKHVNIRANATTTKTSELNEALQQTKDKKLSANKGDNATGQQKKNQGFENSFPSSRLSKDQGETVILVSVDRSKNQHVVEIKSEIGVKSVAKRPKVLEIVRAENSNDKPQNKHIPSTSIDGVYASVVKSAEGVAHEVHNRSQELVQTARKQIHVQTKIVSSSCNSRSNVAVMPISLGMSREKVNDEQRSPEEINAALQCPINIPNQVNIDQLEAPAEDDMMCAEMDKLCNELKMKAQKDSLREKPGSTVSVNKNADLKSSQCNSETNDDSVLIDSNKNRNGKVFLTSAKAEPTLYVQSMVIPNQMKNDTANLHETEIKFPRKSCVSGKSESNVTVPQTHSALQQKAVNSTMADVLEIKSPQPETLSYPPSPALPMTIAQHNRPSSPRLISQPLPLGSPNYSPEMADTTSPNRTILDALRTTIRTEPQRPASAPPGLTTRRQTSSDYSDNEFEIEKKENDNILNKFNEIIKVKPRKDKAEGVKNKTKIPAPKPLASMRKSCSFSSVSSIIHSMSAPEKNKSGKTYVSNDIETNGSPELVNNALNETLSERSETSSHSPKSFRPLTTGRSSLIRTESIEKNKTTSGNRFVRAVSMDRNTCID